MADIPTGGSPRWIARLTGAFYLYIMVAALFAETFVRDKLVVTRDPAATLHNIAEAEPLWRWGIAADVSTTMCDVAVTALLFILLRPVSRGASVAAAFFRLAYSATMAAAAGFLIAPLALIRSAASSSPDITSSLVMLSLRLHAASFDVALVFFGIHLVLVGGLIARSTFLPRALGVALGIAGACYAVNSFAGFVAPAFAAHLFPWILLPGFLAEAALTLWLLIAGVNVQRWRAAGASD